MRTLLACLLFACLSALAQTNGGTGSSAPASCIPGTIFVNTSTGVLQVCTTTDTWTQAAWVSINGGGTPTVTRCGSSPSVSRTDAAGVITTASRGVTCCTLHL